jgi:GLPGLI family protein
MQLIIKRNSMKKCLFSILLLTFYFSLYSQDIFISKGKIEFERKVNLYKNLDDQSSTDQDGGFDWAGQLKKQVHEYSYTYFNLYFDDNKTLYKPGREVTQTQKIPEWFQGPAQNNVVFCDLQLKKTVAQKTVYESTFLIQDSLRKAKWKITNDTRDIAGFKCRKATTIIMDSVFVIAFYTDQVTTSGGPESFNSLPGMILGLAVPRLHTTWFATKVELTEPKPEELAAPAKGKKANSDELVQKLKNTMQDWGKWGQHAQWEILL